MFTSSGISFNTGRIRLYAQQLGLHISTAGSTGSPSLVGELRTWMPRDVAKETNTGRTVNSWDTAGALATKANSGVSDDTLWVDTLGYYWGISYQRKSMPNTPVIPFLGIPA